MQKDFYLDERWLAAYFEKDWADHVFKEIQPGQFGFEYPQFDSMKLYSNYHREFVDFLASKIDPEIKPDSLLEIGSSLGRTFYELCNQIPTLTSATLLEPSQMLADCFSKIFSGRAISAFPMLLGNRELQNIEVDTRAIGKSCGRVKFSLLNSQFQDIDSGKTFDLVVCSNVIDQCHNPLELIEVLKNSTKAGGILALSCTYQWNDKYLEASKQNITNVANYFGKGWSMLGEKDIEFKVRRSERHWMTFLSHAIVLKKTGV